MEQSSMITSTPRKPMHTASHRRTPTCSPSKGTESAQTHSGKVKLIAAVWANCR